MSTTVQSSISAHPLETQAQPIRRHITWSRGDAAHQGDLIFICLGAVMPSSCRKRMHRQLAEADTRGSKHMAVGGEVFDADPDQIVSLIGEATAGKVSPGAEYIGPVICGPCTIEHPEHQHQAFPEGCVTAVVFQRNQTAEEQEQRARD